jgi:hypothetical protein
LLPDGVVNSLADVRGRPADRQGSADVIKCATTGGASSRGHGPRDGAFNLDEMQALTERPMRWIVG